MDVADAAGSGSLNAIKLAQGVPSGGQQTLYASLGPQWQTGVATVSEANPPTAQRHDPLLTLGLTQHVDGITLPAGHALEGALHGVSLQPTRVDRLVVGPDEFGQLHKRQKRERPDELNLSQEQINLLAQAGVQAVALDEKNGVKVQIATDNQGNTTTITLPKRIEEMDEKELEKELKKERRKQSNRESARRSRLRKQAEVERLNISLNDIGQQNNRFQDELKKYKVAIATLAQQVQELGGQVNPDFLKMSADVADLSGQR